MTYILHLQIVYYEARGHTVRLGLPRQKTQGSLVSLFFCALCTHMHVRSTQQPQPAKKAAVASFFLFVPRSFHFVVVARGSSVFASTFRHSNKQQGSATLVLWSSLLKPPLHRTSLSPKYRANVVSKTVRTAVNTKKKPNNSSLKERKGGTDVVQYV